MTRSRRAARRQGVIYGPPRDREPGASASFLGRVMGAAVVVTAFAVLAAGTYAFLGRSPAASNATPTPTAVAASLSPSPTASSVPTLSPSATPTPLTTLPPSPSPSPSAFVIAVVEGPGAITFGTQFNRNTLRITDPRVEFPPTGRFVWSAQLTEPADSPQLTTRLHAYDPATGEETLVSETTVDVNNQNASIFLRRPQMQRLVPGPGIYVLRYFRGDTLLAEGYFQVNPE